MTSSTSIMGCGVIGNTTGFDPVIQGSSPCIPTTLYSGSLFPSPTLLQMSEPTLATIRETGQPSDALQGVSGMYVVQ